MSSLNTYRHTGHRSHENCTQGRGRPRLPLAGRSSRARAWSLEAASPSVPRPVKPNKAAVV
eukprot:4238084-Prymnesium_polylepis.1